jgi:aspartyl-tRNA(Asn)/glutamyl-tRNA(Gln) amidotransferase subunit A
MASSYDQIGTFTKTVEDAAIALDVICGRDEKDNTSIEKGETKFFERLNGDLRGKKIGIVKDFFENGLDENIKKAVLERVAYAASQGAKIVDIELPHSRYALGVYYLMITSEISSNMARFDGIKYGMSAEAEKTSLLDVYLHSRQKGLGAEVKRRIILGTYALSSGYYDAYYKKAQKVRELIKKDFQQAFSQVDVLISPTSPTTAFKISEKTENPLEMYLADIYTVSVNVAGIPAMSIPGGMVQSEEKSLPLGVQIMGKWWDEQTMLDVAKGIEG